MNVLVVGGAGYIGSTVVVLLQAAGHRVVVYDDLSNGHRGAVPAAVPLIVGSTGDAALLDRVFGENAVDVVMHFAASIEAGESMKVPDRYFRNNTANTLTLVEAMLRHDVKRLVFSSTAALFGTPEEVPITEDAPKRPTNAYGESKLLVERMLDWINAGARPKLRLPSLLQRRRRARRAITARTTAGNPPHPDWRSRSPSAGARRSRSSAPTTRPATAPASATTSMSPTSPRPTSSPWPRSPSGDGCSTTSATARVSACAR